MITEGLEAWVLHKRPSGDTSARVTFFTREKGIVNGLCKGGRTPKKQALLQPFSPLWLAIELRRDWPYVRQFETFARPLEFEGNSLFAGLYVNELLYYVLSPMDAHPDLFDMYLHTLQGLSSSTDKLVIEVLLRRFEYALLVASGYSVSFTTEANSLKPIEFNQVYQFIAGEGFVVADKGIEGSDILALAQGQLDEIKVLKTAKFIMRQAVDHLLGGRELKSRSLYPHKKIGM